MPGGSFPVLYRCERICYSRVGWAWQGQGEALTVFPGSTLALSLAFPVWLTEMY